VRGNNVMLVCVITWVAFLTALVASNLREQQRAYERTVGPDPGYAYWETENGSKGAMRVRDAKNAEQEARAEIEGIRRLLESSPNVRVKGEWPEIRFRTFEVKRDCDGRR
jgi:hypothetical protein